MFPVPPPRPPLPHESQLDTPSGSSYLPGGGGGGIAGMGAGGMASSSAAGYPETTDDESEDLFHYAPTPSQGPIMASHPFTRYSLFPYQMRPFTYRAETLSPERKSLYVVARNGLFLLLNMSAWPSLAVA